MSRVIKFRAWWRADLEPVDDINERPISDLNANHLIIEQFTGLLDCNGAEIFEGDVVRFFYNSEYNNIDFVGVVEHDIYNPCFVIVNPKNRNQIEYDWVLCGLANIEIIGNIHQQPELLK